MVSGFFIFRRDDTEQQQIANYQDAYNRLMTSSDYLSSPSLFEYTIQSQLLPVGGKYLVTLSIDSATIRMGDLVLIAAETVPPVSPRYYPSIGIFQDFGLILIPQDEMRQSSKETKGINLSFQSLTSPTEILLYCRYETTENVEVIQYYRLTTSSH